jgi:hypothetical protein
MRPTAGADGLALHTKYRMRFDPLNALAMCIWADELRRGPLAKVGDISAANKIRLIRVYQALLKLRPGDSVALTYLNELDKGGAAADPAPPGADPKPADPIAKKDAPANQSVRDEVARVVVRAVTARARANTGAGARTGDELTAAYVRAAVDAALGAEGVPAEPRDRMAGFLVGLGVALDDTDTLRADPLTDAAAKAAETDAQREERLAVLGNPTLRGRRDLCRRFALGCATAELVTPTRAEDVAVNRALSPAGVSRPAGIGFPGLAAELAGAEYARAARNNPELLRRLPERFSAAAVIPDLAGLRDGLSPERFEEDYGDASDDRFRAVLADIRERVKKLPAAGR